MNLESLHLFLIDYSCSLDTLLEYYHELLGFTCNKAHVSRVMIFALSNRTLPRQVCFWLCISLSCRYTAPTNNLKLCLYITFLEPCYSADSVLAWTEFHGSFVCKNYFCCAERKYLGSILDHLSCFHSQQLAPRILQICFKIQGNTHKNMEQMLLALLQILIQT